MIAAKGAIFHKYKSRVQGWQRGADPGTPLHALLQELEDSSVETFLMNSSNANVLKGNGKGLGLPEVLPSCIEKIIEKYTPAAEGNLFCGGIQMCTDFTGENMHGGEVLGRLGQCVPAFGAKDVEKAPLGLITYVENSRLRMQLYQKDIDSAKICSCICERRQLLSEGTKFSTNLNWGKLNKDELKTLFHSAGHEVELELKEKTPWENSKNLFQALEEVRADVPQLSTILDDAYVAKAMPMMQTNSPIPDVMENNNAITLVDGTLFVGRDREKVPFSNLWSVKKLKWDQEFLRLIFRGLTFHDRMPDCLPDVHFIGYGLCKKTMVRMIYEAAFNDRIVDRTCCSTIDAEADDKGAPAVEIGDKKSTPLSLPPQCTAEEKLAAERVVFERGDCFFDMRHSELCAEWGSAVKAAQTAQIQEQVNEGCDPWPLPRDIIEELTGKDIDSDFKAIVFGSTDDKSNMEGMLNDTKKLMKAVHVLYMMVEARSGIRLRDFKWQGALRVTDEDGSVHVLGDIAFIPSDLNE